MLPQFGDPLAYVVDLIQDAFPAATVTGDPKIAQTGPFTVRRGSQFVFVQIQGGSTPSFLLQTNVRFEVISYVWGDDDINPSVFAQQIERAFYLAAMDQRVFANGHARRPVTEVRPYHQALQGLPANVFRHSGTYSIGYRSR